jgi:hypothetical protein
LYGEDEDQWGMVLHEVPRARSNREKEGRTLTLIFGFVYRISLVYMRTGGPNIYMYRRGRIYKEPLEKYNNRKVAAQEIKLVKT